MPSHIREEFKIRGTDEDIIWVEHNNVRETYFMNPDDRILYYTEQRGVVIGYFYIETDVGRSPDKSFMESARNGLIKREYGKYVEY